MSYLNLPSINLADFSKGTISLWFRFSKDSVKNAEVYGASYQPPDGGDFASGPDVFRSTIPLVTFGRKVMAKMWGAVPHVWTQVAGGATLTRTTFDSVDKGEAPCEPSHLGLEVDDKGEVTLKMIFQTETRAQVQGLVTEAIDVHWAQPSPGFPYQEYQEVRDISYIRTAVPEQFKIIPKFKIDTDQWHHLLVSFDFSTSVDVVALANYTGDNAERDAIRSYCKLWFAFDDENQDGEPNMGASWAFHGPNDVVPVSALEAAFSYFPTTPPVDAVGNPTITGELYDPEYHWVASKIPTNGGPVGLPASAEYVDTIYHVEMAEFQFFAGLVIDTSVRSIRRAFVDAAGVPVDPEDTEKMVGRRPDILLHGTSDWQSGANTGSTGVEIDPEGNERIIKSGQFQHIGLIEEYTPDPILSEHSTA